MSADLLVVENLTKRFGGLVAVDNLSFRAKQGQITAIIGPNGAGKTTLFNCLTGFYPVSTGKVTLNRPDGERFQLERMSGHTIARDAKVVRTFQNVRLFAGMTALENLMVAQHGCLMRASLYSVGGLLGTLRYRNAEKAAIDQARYWLDRFGLGAIANEAAGSLAYGSQRKLEIARAMCADPAVLCLDEPAAGLNPREGMELANLLLEIRRERGLGVLLIEHDMKVVMKIADHIVVLDHGCRIAEGAPADVRANPNVVRAYLGEAE